MMARGVVAMCSASSSMPTVTMAWFASDGSPLRAKVEAEPTNRMRALPAMVDLQRFEEEEKCKIKV
jgi:hypothetical protein